MAPNSIKAGAALLILLAAANANARETNLLIDVEDGALAATLLAPDMPYPGSPAALIIAGSGPTDRNGNSPLGGPDTLRLLAEGLQRCGIASLRYDKRGVGGSAFPNLQASALTLDDFVSDAVHAADFLAKHDDVSEVWLLGHSEGALIALAAQADAQARRLVLLAAASQRYLDILQRQLNERLPATLRPSAMKALKRLRAGESVATDELPAELGPMFHAGLQPFLRSADRFDPLALIATTDVPVAIIQGDTDLQVRTEDATALANAAPSATVEIVAGMNHMLKAQGGDLAEQANSYADPNLPLHPALLASLCPNDATVTAAPHVFAASHHPQLAGDWSGKIKRVGLRAVFHIRQTENGLSATFDSPDQNAYGLTLSMVSEHDGTVVLASNTIGFRFDGTLKQDGKRWVIDGQFAQSGQQFELTLRKRK